MPNAQHHQLVPPLRYRCIAPQVYVGAYPTLQNFGFLYRLQLKTIISLIPERPTTDLTEFCHHVNSFFHSTIIPLSSPTSTPTTTSTSNMTFSTTNNNNNNNNNNKNTHHHHQQQQHPHIIHMQHYKVSQYKDSVQGLSFSDMSRIIECILDRRQGPIYIHCLDGRHVSSLVVMCLRKLQNYTHDCLVRESKRFVSEWSSEDLDFVKQWKGPVNIPHGDFMVKWCRLPSNMTPTTATTTSSTSITSITSTTSKILPKTTTTTTTTIAGNKQNSDHLIVDIGRVDHSKFNILSTSPSSTASSLAQQQQQQQQQQPIIKSSVTTGTVAGITVICTNYTYHYPSQHYDGTTNRLLQQQHRTRGELSSSPSSLSSLSSSPTSSSSSSSLARLVNGHPGSTTATAQHNKQSKKSAVVGSMMNDGNDADEDDDDEDGHFKSSKSSLRRSKDSSSLLSSGSSGRNKNGRGSSGSGLSRSVTLDLLATRPGTSPQFDYLSKSPVNRSSGSKYSDSIVSPVNTKSVIGALLGSRAKQLLSTSPGVSNLSQLGQSLKDVQQHGVAKSSSGQSSASSGGASQSSLSPSSPHLQSKYSPGTLQDFIDSTIHSSISTSDLSSSSSSNQVSTGHDPSLLADRKEVLRPSGRYNRHNRHHHRHHIHDAMHLSDLPLFERMKLRKEMLWFHCSTYLSALCLEFDETHYLEKYGLKRHRDLHITVQSLELDGQTQETLDQLYDEELELFDPTQLTMTQQEQDNLDIDGANDGEPVSPTLAG